METAMEFAKSETINRIMVTGGGGYVGSSLVPMLLDYGYQVTVFDTFWYGRDVFGKHNNNENLTRIEGDLRNVDDVERALGDCDAVIHLACISNDPSFDLQPDLGRSINFDCFEPLVKRAKSAGVKRFIYASSSSVYGVKDKSNVVETDSLEPLTDYSIFKAKCEQILEKYRGNGFVTTTIRPATVCGYSTRQRLDVVVNILTNLAYNKGEITVFGGDQLRPNIHIVDMCRIYLLILASIDEKIDGEIFNAGYENHSVSELASMVKDVIGPEIKIITQPTDDNRSYHVSSEKIKTVLGFKPSKTIKNAVEDLVENFKAGNLPDSLTSPEYFNIKKMQELNVS
jgi:nucleoside-diphosphate-sugar epimerase